jgi:plasmid maintenance system antidote protein VapI
VIRCWLIRQINENQAIQMRAVPSLELAFGQEVEVWVWLQQAYPCSKQTQLGIF